MPCYHPLEMHFTGRKTANGKNEYCFDIVRSADPARKVPDWHVSVPCGQCLGCRLAKVKEWSCRILFEAQMHTCNCFVTLTYAPEHLPDDGSLHVEHLQRFFKRLRKGGCKFRYFACGEYGAQYQRPHFHVIFFGLDFYGARKSAPKNPFNLHMACTTWTSDVLSKAWPYGYHTIGTLTYASAAYVAKYTLKKITGRMADEVYQGRRPEFVVMSRRPGIASDWYDKYHTDLESKDCAVFDVNRRCKVPRYFDKLFSRNNGDEALEILKFKRMVSLAEHFEDLTLERLKARELYTAKAYRVFNQSRHKEI